MRSTRSFVRLLLPLAILVFVGTGCIPGMKKPWRDYSQRPFDAAAWREGDAIERGRMASDFQGMRKALQGHRQEKIVEMLGEPDLKKTIENREVWFYRVDIGIVGGMDLVPVSFDPKGLSLWGVARGGTFSAMAKEEDL